MKSEESEKMRNGKWNTRMRRLEGGHRMVAFAISCILATSCIRDADDEAQPTPPTTDTISVGIDSAVVVIDSVFRASEDYMHGEWMAQYAGYDPLQSAASGKDVVSAIRRLVYFSADGMYESHVQGIVDTSDTITIYKEFEHERGIYAFDAERQMMTYSVEYDSLLNFGADEMEFHPGKVRGQAEMAQYGEKMWFSLEMNGKRDWIREDDNLMSASDHSARLIYVMKNQK